MNDQSSSSHDILRAASRRGLALVLSSPSGAGKTTLTRDLLATKALDLTLSISVTTRARRPSEIEGVHYHFITERQFEQMRSAGDLLEWAHVHGNYYGTPMEPVKALLESGRICLLDLDYQGAAQCREALKDDVVSIFILPPSLRELRARLERRAEDSAEVIEKRLANARHEIPHWQSYDYVLVNADKQACYLELLSIIHAERLRQARNASWLRAFIERDLLAS